MEKVELKVRLSRENLDFLERYAAARHLTAAKIIELSLRRLREEETERTPAGSAPVSHEARARFDRLAEEWRAAVQYVSSLSQMVTHPAYQRIIGLGNAAIPLLLNRLGDRPEHWFWALKAITGADPVAAEDRGNIDAMRGAWLAWGQREGYC